MTAAGELHGWIMRCVFILLPILLYASRAYAAPSAAILGAAGTVSLPGTDEPTSSIDADTLQARAEEFVLPQIPDYIEVESLKWSGVKPVSGLAAGSEIEFTPPTRFTWFGPQRLSAEVIQDGRRRSRIWLTFEVRGNAKVLTASRGFARGKVLEEKDVRTETVALQHLPADFTIDVRGLIGRKALRHFREGEVLSVRSFERIPDVRKGDKVHLVVQQSMFKVETVGVAQESGSVGDVIFVKSRGTGKAVLGRIVSDHRVEVTL